MNKTEHSASDCPSTKLEPFVDSLVDQNRSMHELAHSRAAWDRTADERKAFQETDVIENGITEAFRRGREV